MSFLKSNHYLRNVQLIIDSIGDENITEINIARRPLSKATLFLLNITSLGEFNKRIKETPHDVLFHLFMTIKTSKGTYVLEKNDVINMKKFTGFSKDTEITSVNKIKSGLTLNILLEKTKQLMGNKFFNYKGLDNNCQFFVSSILKSNGLNNSELSTFVLQDTRRLFNNNPYFRKLVNSITDGGAISNRIIQKVDEITKQPIKQTFQNELLNPILRKFTFTKPTVISNELMKPNEILEE